MRKLKYGIPGETDLQGIIAPMGRFLAIEVKTGTGKLSDEQESYKAMIQKFGGLHIVARNVQQVLDELNSHSLV